jgi:large subunit ribosomal protein L30
MAETRLLITWVKSSIGAKQDQKDTVRALGLHRRGQVVEHADTPALRGMIKKVIHLIKVEEVQR